MGVWMSLFVSSASKEPLDYQNFERLLLDLIEEKLVKMPCAILEGDVESSSPLGMANIANRSREEEISIRFKGNDEMELKQSLRTIPFGKTDFCVWFDGLNWDNERVRTSFQRHGYANGDVVIYSFASPREVIIYDAYDGTWCKHQFSHYFTVTGKNGPEAIQDTVLEPILERYFGPNLIVECTYS